ncbi:M23 family metallopeptidase [Streptomyces sp. CC77]|uniref:M23 family metallopeptidase n=1 Tax=Streptomyces sp. CC77 TaxID=1906739 RepID=UPI0015875A91|nr:M23 family metallopeptidase [Streptomyces sp. CC77]
MPVSAGRKTGGRLSLAHTAGYSRAHCFPSGRPPGAVPRPCPAAEAREKLVNDQHPHADCPSRGAYPTGSHETGGYDAGTYGTGTYDTGAYATGTYDSGTYGTTAYDTGAYATSYDSASQGGYDAGHSGSYDTGQYGTGTWVGAASAATQHWDAGGYTGQWDAGAWNQAHEAQQADAAQQFAPTSAYDTTGQWYAGGLDTGSYDATAWADAPAGAGAADTPGLADGQAEHTPETFVPEQYDYATADEAGLADTTSPGHAAGSAGEHPADGNEQEAHSDTAHTSDFGAEYAGYGDGHPYDSSDYGSSESYDGYEGYGEGTDHADAGAEETDPEPVVTAGSAAAAAARPVRRAGGSRGRRRPTAKRSALLTVAVPSACVMGVAGIAAASVSGLTTADGKEEAASVASDVPPVKPAVANQALDTQLAALDTGARDFGDRASRTQERIDLKERQEAERKRKAEEAARREAMRPKFALPVELHQLSARYGQAGVNWMSLHSGIDFPVQYGTPVMAATDGTVRTQWNSAYGNMVIVTAKDGTETWYCHLSTAKIRSGPVKAGDVIAYSGNSGNSTGPHLHFEVRPGGGTAVDPEAWLRSHGLSPTG